MNNKENRVNPFWTTVVFLNLLIRDLLQLMSTESLNRTSDVIETPRVNVDVLKQRIIDQKKKDKCKRNIIVSSVCVSIGVLTILSS